MQNSLFYFITCEDLLNCLTAIVAFWTNWVLVAREYISQQNFQENELKFYKGWQGELVFFVPRSIDKYLSYY